MITSQDQAYAVQSRRRKTGKRGIAKAVRRWYRRRTGAPSIALRSSGPGEIDYDKLAGNFQGCRSWEETQEGKPLKCKVCEGERFIDGNQCRICGGTGRERAVKMQRLSLQE